MSCCLQNQGLFRIIEDPEILLRGLCCSYGVVHVCIDDITKQKAAVKILPKVRSKQQPQKTLKKLEREVALMARVSRQSRGITPLIDVYEDKNYVYIVMGLNEGGDLEQLLEVCSSLHLRRKLLLCSCQICCHAFNFACVCTSLKAERLHPGCAWCAEVWPLLRASHCDCHVRVPEDHLRLPCQRCVAMSTFLASATMFPSGCLRDVLTCCLHGAGVLLGDIKPANFMLRHRYRDPLKALEGEHLGEGFLSAIDFGCSQAVGPAPLARRTGTPVYMSPETFRREYHLEAE